MLGLPKIRMGARATGVGWSGKLGLPRSQAFVTCVWADAVGYASPPSPLPPFRRRELSVAGARGGYMVGVAVAVSPEAERFPAPGRISFRDLSHGKRASWRLARRLCPPRQGRGGWLVRLDVAAS